MIFPTEKAHTMPGRVNENTKIHHCKFSGNWGQKEDFTSFGIRMDLGFSIATPEAGKQWRKMPSRL